MPTSMCTETLESLWLSEGTPAAMCVGKKEYVIEDLKLIKTILEKYLCIYAFTFISAFSVYSLCFLHLS